MATKYSEANETGKMEIHVSLHIMCVREKLGKRMKQAFCSMLAGSGRVRYSAASPVSELHVVALPLSRLHVAAKLCKALIDMWGPPLPFPALCVIWRSSS